MRYSEIRNYTEDAHTHNPRDKRVDRKTCYIKHTERRKTGIEITKNRKKEKMRKREGKKTSIML